MTMMISAIIWLAASLLPLTHSAETVVGVYLVVRHGDRTSKEAPPTTLTNLGYEEVHDTGSYYHNRYINASSSNSDLVILGINGSAVKNSQISTTAPPADNVLQNSAQGFLQGLYPPTPRSETLRDGTVVQAPLGGYQLIPVASAASGGSGQENSAWLQGQTGCGNALVSSNAYFSTPEYTDLLSSTKDFYKRLDPIISGAYTGDDQSFKNAYAIFDFIDFATVHNKTIPSDNLLDSDTLLQLHYLANVHEFNLAFNASDTIRAVAGSTLAAEIVKGLNQTITTAGKTKLNVQFNSYGYFTSFFGLAQLLQLDPDFYGIVNYASSMSFELFTDGPTDPFPAPDALNVRFLFHNGTMNGTSELKAYPLFGQNDTALPWNTFVDKMGNISLSGQAWCTACGNNTGSCAPASSTGSPSSTPSSSSSSSNNGGGGGGVSKAVAGVIGAFVTLAVILGLAVLAIVIGGLRLVSKKRLSHTNGVSNGATSKAS